MAPFAVGATAALGTQNCDYAGRPGDALRIAVVLVPVSDAVGRRVPARADIATTVAGSRCFAPAVVAAGRRLGRRRGLQREVAPADYRHAEGARRPCPIAGAA